MYKSVETGSAESCPLRFCVSDEEKYWKYGKEDLRMRCLLFLPNTELERRQQKSFTVVQNVKSTFVSTLSIYSAIRGSGNLCAANGHFRKFSSIISIFFRSYNYINEEPYKPMSARRASSDVSGGLLKKISLYGNLPDISLRVQILFFYEGYNI